MPKEVRVRGLPGGPVDIEFSDDISRRCTCTKCRMVASMMYMDPNEHAFCEHCINECSAQRKIYCSEERKDIDFNVMEEAFTVITILAKMKVFCPNRNKGCESTIEFRRLKDHFMECDKTLLKCECCRKSLKGKEYKSHKLSCSKKIVQCPYCFKAEPQATLKEHKKRCGEEMTHCSKCADDILKKDYKLHEYQCTGVKKRKKEDLNVRTPALTSTESTDLQRFVPPYQREDLVSGPPSLVTSRGYPEEDQNVRPLALTSTESTDLQHLVPDGQRDNLVTGPLVTSRGNPEVGFAESSDHQGAPVQESLYQTNSALSFHSCPPCMEAGQKPISQVVSESEKRENEQRRNHVCSARNEHGAVHFSNGFVESSDHQGAPVQEPPYHTSITSSVPSYQLSGEAEQKPISQVVSVSEEWKTEQRRNHICAAQEECGTVDFSKGFVKSTDHQGAPVQEQPYQTNSASSFHSCPPSMEAEQRPISETSFRYVLPGSNVGPVQPSTSQPDEGPESYVILNESDIRSLEQEQQPHQPSTTDARVQGGSNLSVRKEAQVADAQLCLNSMVQISRKEHQEFLAFKKEKEDLLQENKMLKEQVCKLQLQTQYLLQENKMLKEQVHQLQSQPQENKMLKEQVRQLQLQLHTSEYQRMSECGEVPHTASAGRSTLTPDLQSGKYLYYHGGTSQHSQMPGHGECPSAVMLTNESVSNYGRNCNVDNSLQPCKESFSGGSQNRLEHTVHSSSSKGSFQATQRQGESPCVGYDGHLKPMRLSSNPGDFCQEAKASLPQRTSSYGTLLHTRSNGLSKPAVTSEPRVNGNGRTGTPSTSVAATIDRRYKGEDSFENRPDFVGIPYMRDDADGE